MRGSAIAGIAAVGLLLAACGNGGDDGEAATEPTDEAAGDTDEAAGEMEGVSGEDLEGELTISVQPGIGYAPLIVMKQQGTLEEALPNMEINWEELASGAAIRDAIVAGDVHVGSGGVGPFFVGWGAGLDYRVLSSMNNMDLWLMTMDDSIQSVADFGPDDRIAMPGPDSIQSVHLRRAAQEELGDPNALDKNIVAMPHPDGVAALIGGQIAGHLTSPPFMFNLRDEGAEPVLTSYDLWGESTFNTIYTTQEYYDENREVMDILYDLNEEAVNLLNEDPAAAAELLSAEQGGDPDAAQFEEWVTEEGVEYTVVPQGVLEIGKFMAEIEMIDQAPEDLEEILLDRARESGGS